MKDSVPYGFGCSTFKLLSWRSYYDRERRSRHGRSSSPPPPSLVTTTTIAISPTPQRSSPPPSLLRSVLTLGRVAAAPFTLIIGGEQLPPQASSLQQLLQIGLTAILHASYVCCRSPRGMTLPKLCPNVCKVVVVSREQELLLCRGDVSNSSPSRLKRMLQSLTGMPSATFEGIVTVKTETFFFFAYVC
ncbi:unnamed protein product [Brassica oleracea]